MYIPRNILFIFNVLLCTVLAESDMDPSDVSTYLNESEGESRIIHGRDAKEGEIPYQVGIWDHEKTFNNFRCGGSLISRTFILSAARCFYDDQTAEIYYVSLGSVKRMAGLTRQGRSLIIHPLFTKEHWKNDIALLGIDEVDYTNTISPITLPQMHSNPLYSIAFISGWGYTNEEEPVNLQVGKVLIISNVNCQRIHSITENNMCTISHPSSTCFHDAGGPLVDRDRTILIGIMSYYVTNDDECYDSDEDVHTRVVKYREWISNHTGV